MKNNFTAGYNYYGLNRGEHEGKTGILYREWAPGARVNAHIVSPFAKHLVAHGCGVLL